METTEQQASSAKTTIRPDDDRTTNLSHVLVIILLLLLLMPCASHIAAFGDASPKTKEGTEQKCDLLRSTDPRPADAKKHALARFAKHLQFATHDPIGALESDKRPKHRLKLQCSRPGQGGTLVCDRGVLVPSPLSTANSNSNP